MGTIVKSSQCCVYLLLNPAHAKLASSLLLNTLQVSPPLGIVFSFEKRLIYLFERQSDEGREGEGKGEKWMMYLFVHSPDTHSTFEPL